MRTKRIHIFLLWSVLLFSCSGLNLKLNKSKSICIVSYNVQTFFDAVDDGNEFKTFKINSTGWTAEKYKNRLKRLHSALNIACKELTGEDNKTPDILILQEIESARVIEDFCKSLPKNQSYRYAVFFPPENGGAFNPAVLSKYPITESYSHKLYRKGAHLRPLVEAKISIGGSGLTLFNVHWKSKAGNGGYAARKMQEELLYKRISQLPPEASFIACGDFNQQPEEFSLMTEIKNCWDFEQDLNGAKTDKPGGSYLFRDKWEKIDHFFYSDNLSGGGWAAVHFFSVISSPPLTKKNGAPNRYIVNSGTGYSDHLPIGLILKTEAGKN